MTREGTHPLDQVPAYWGAPLSYASLYREARRAGMQEWQARQFVGTAGPVDVAMLRRCVAKGCPKHLVAQIVL